MVPGLEVAVGYLATWAWRRARRAAGRIEDRVDAAVDAKLEKLYDTVAGKLSGDPSLGKLATEAGQDTAEQPALSDRTRDRVRLSLEDAADGDPAFAAQLADLVAQVKQASGVTASEHGVAAGRDVNVHAESGSVAAVNLHGSVTIGNPPRPGTDQG
ncbi:MAG TPA: hypothetical protein VHA75_14995 [Rugosimonospora sp.]|nr:hypothetical protein [Rugosimonospora sp.]